MHDCLVDSLSITTVWNAPWSLTISTSSMFDVCHLGWHAGPGTSGRIDTRTSNVASLRLTATSSFLSLDPSEHPLTSQRSHHTQTKSTSQHWATRLQALVSLDRLEHAEAGLLHICDSLILPLHQLLVASLELLHLGLEVVLSIGQSLLALGNLSVEVGVGESHSLLDSLLLLSIAQVQVGRTARWSEVLLRRKGGRRRSGHPGSPPCC